MTDYIKILNDVIMESEIDVMNSIINYIDKGDLVNEYGTESCVNDIFMESMMWFMEASASAKRTKDLKQWMKDKGYLYKGNDPNKKKKANRMLHFLQQHDFDPKTSTYLSDIKDRSGNKIRIPLHFDGEGPVLKLTPEEEALKNELVKENGSVDLFDLDTSNELHMSLFGKLTYKSQLESGKNGFYAPSSKDVPKDGMYLSSKMVKGKQAMAQGLVKHEEGHAADYKSRKKEAVIDKQEMADIKRKTNNTKNKLWNTGAFVNQHDKEARERYADAYAVKNAQIRTKNRGKKGNKGTRNFNENDLRKMMNNISKMVTDVGQNISFDAVKSQIKGCISKCDHLLTQPWGKSYKSAITGLINLDSVTDLFDVLNSIDAEKAEKELVNVLKENESDNAADTILKAIQQLKKTSGDIVNDNPHADKQITALNRLLSIDDRDEQNKIIKSIIDGTGSSGPDVKSRLEFSQHTMYSSDKGLSERTRMNLAPIITEADFDKMYNMKTSEERFDYLRKTKVPIIKRWRFQYEKMLKNITELEKEYKGFEDTSSVVRHQMAKQFIKEYFDEFFSDSDLYV